MSAPVLKSSDLGVGDVLPVEVDGRRLAIVRDELGGLHALLDRCPHYGARLSQGVVERLVGFGEETGPRLAEATVLRCPRHRYEFDVSTGICPVDSRQRVRCYPVFEREGTVYVGSDPEGGATDERVGGAKWAAAR